MISVRKYIYKIADKIKLFFIYKFICLLNSLYRIIKCEHSTID